MVLLDFFSELPRSLQKPWRDLLLGRTSETAFSTRYPEIEGHLKLLYTAVTRSMHRLFFAETKSSIAGDAFVRWITTCSTKSASDSERRTIALATRCSIDDVEKMKLAPDDWSSTGFDNMIMAESGDDLEAAAGWIEKAIYCFQQAEDAELASKARIYKSSVHFRTLLLHVDDQKDGFDCSEVEPEVARLLKSLLVEQLVVEAVKLCRAALPFLSTFSQEKVQALLINRLSRDEFE